MEGKCDCSTKCYCKGGVLIVLGVLGLLAHFNVWTLPYLSIIWPVLSIILGILVLVGVCCCNMTAFPKTKK